jgi:hypothetical protein
VTGFESSQHILVSMAEIQSASLPSRKRLTRNDAVSRVGRGVVDPMTFKDQPRSCLRRRFK